MIVVEHDGTISLTNSKFGELTGYAPADMKENDIW